MSNANSSSDWPDPWPIQSIIECLQEGRTLHDLTGPRQSMRGHDVRENALEDLVHNVMVRPFGKESVTVRKPIGTSLRLQTRPFPASAQPDIAVQYQGSIDVAELKSGRTDYNRFDCVFDSNVFQAYLLARGHNGLNPWEVEQDLIKLHLYKELSPLVGSCLFLMVDAYKGAGRSWSRVLASRRTFVATTRTDLVRGWADKLLQATRIQPIVTIGARARLITCEVHAVNRHPD